MATLSLTVASCDFCSSDRRFASTFLQIPLALIIVVAMKRTPLVLAVSFPLLGRIRDFHPLETCAARRTMKMGTGSQNPSPALLLCSVRLKSFTSYFIGFHHNEECFFILVFDRLLYIVHFFIAARTHYNQFIIP